MSRRSTAAARTVSLFDGRTDEERPKHEGRDGSLAESPRRRVRTRTEVAAAGWETVPTGGIPRLWKCGDLSVERNGLDVFVVRKGRRVVGEHHTLTAAIVAAERAR